MLREDTYTYCTYTNIICYLDNFFPHRNLDAFFFPHRNFYPQISWFCFFFFVLVNEMRYQLLPEILGSGWTYPWLRWALALRVEHSTVVKHMGESDRRIISKTVEVLFVERGKYYLGRQTMSMQQRNLFLHSFVYSGRWCLFISANSICETKNHREYWENSKNKFWG